MSSCWNTSEKLFCSSVPTPSSPTTQPCNSIYLLGTGDQLLAEASPYETFRGIRYRADHKNALCPPACRGLNLSGKVLQIVRQRLRDRAPPLVRHHHASPPRGDSPAQGRYYIFEVDPSSQHRPPICDDSYANPIPSFRFWSGRKNKCRSCKSKQASCAKSDAEMVLGRFVCLLV